MKKILILLSAFSLTSCAVGTALDAVAAAPAPLATTAIDEKGLVIALQTFDTLLTAIDRLVAAGVIVPGTPRALQLADAIRTAKYAYVAASAAQRVGNSGSYAMAITQGQLAIANINLLIKGN